MLLSLFLHLDTFLNMGRGLMTEGFWSQLPRDSTSRGLGVEEAGVEEEAEVDTKGAGEVAVYLLSGISRRNSTPSHTSMAISPDSEA